MMVLARCAVCSRVDACVMDGDPPEWLIVRDQISGAIVPEATRCPRCLSYQRARSPQTEAR